MATNKSKDENFENDRKETNNDQIKKSKPGDHDPHKNEQARKDLNEHTREHQDKESLDDE
ncbi:MAG: hypothetical protein ACM3O3_00430 [Syntrophothermus sp.]